MDAELVAVEAEYQRLAAQRETLRTRVAAYDAIIATSELPPRPAVAEARYPPIVTSQHAGENLIQRVRRILPAVAPDYLSPRQLMEALQNDGWTTASSNPIMIVRNSMGELAKRIPEIDKRENDDGTIGYGWRQVADSPQGGG